MLTFFKRIRKGLLEGGTTSKYLLYAVGEIALVVIGILIALQINNWNGALKDKTLRQDYTKRLIQDLRSDSTIILLTIKGIQSKQASIETLIHALENNATSVDMSYLGVDYMVKGYTYNLIHSTSTTYRDMVQSGIFRLIKNPDLNKMIIEYYNLFEKEKRSDNINFSWMLPSGQRLALDTDAFRVEPLTKHLFNPISNDDVAKVFFENKDQWMRNAAGHYWINLKSLEKLKEMISHNRMLISGLKEELEN